MARIRELLVGPVVADEAARTAQSINTLDEAAKSQGDTIASLKLRIEELEGEQRASAEQLKMRLLGLVEAIFSDDREIRERLMKNELLRSKIRKNENGIAE